MKKIGMIMTPDLAEKTHQGLKTVTRRTITPQPGRAKIGTTPWNWQHSQRGRIVAESEESLMRLIARWSPWRPGQIRSIKETHWRWGKHERNAKGNWYFNAYSHCNPIIFSEPVSCHQVEKPHLGYHKISALFLPYDLARTHIKILSVRPERLQDIDNTDILLEGITPLEGEPPGDDPWDDFEVCYVQAFRELWDPINGKKHPWVNNDYVWRYEYKKVEKPE